LGLLGYALYYAAGVLALGAGYGAKVMCSAVFVSGLAPERVRAEELSGLLRLIDTEIDRDQPAVEATFQGLLRKRAIHRPGLGCTLIHDPVSEPQLRREGRRLAARRAPGPPRSEPLPGAPTDQLSAPARARLESIVDKAFEEPDPEHPIRTRALLVLHRGQIVAERYAAGIDADTPLVGWSMTKSIINALIGVLVAHGRLAVDQPAPIESWQEPDDPRAGITVDALLRMTSGIDFDERTGPLLSDINRLLFLEPDAVAYAGAKGLAHEPETHWAYTGASTNLLSGVIRRILGQETIDYWAFPHEALFDRIGMRSAVIEPDSAGNLVGSSFSYATARDWARLGLLYLNDGIWAGERILPEGWVAYTTRPTAQAPGRVYGAHWWLAWREPEDPADEERPIAYSAQGYEGQYVVVVPEAELVVVRLGQTPTSSGWEMRPLVEAIVDALAPETAETES
jgi:CubicO group peptidase (beta-lactamase class C family)